MGRAARDPGDLDTFEAVNKGRPAVDGRTAVTLLAVIVVTPSQDLTGVGDGQAVESAH